MARFSVLHSPFSIAIDCRLMYYRAAGVAHYTRRLVRAMAQRCRGAEEQGGISSAPLLPCTFAVLIDRRDTDTSWLPSNVRAIRTITPAHHRYEHITLPAELLPFTFHVLHSPDFITARGRFKKVITIHDLYFMEHPEVMSADGARYYSRLRWSAQTADRIIAVSHFTRNEIVRLMPEVDPSKIAIVHEAADDRRPTTDDYSHVVHRLLSVVSSRYTLFVGTFEPRKNLVTLLRALKHTPDDLQLVIVGEPGWGKAEPRRIAHELGVSERIHLAGRVSDEELDALYRGARLFTMPSLSEGFGLPVLEAMARGVPAVCSNAGALPEIAGDAALFHEPLDDVALAQALIALWTNDALRNEYSKRGLQRARQFSWQLAAQETLEVYHSAI